MNHRSLYFLLLVALCALGLSSCVMQTHQRVLDTAKEYDAIVILHNAVYRQGNRLYVQGVKTTVRRSGRVLMHCPVLESIGTKPERTGTYTILPDAPRKTVYCEFSLWYGKKPFDVVSYAHSGGCIGNSPPDDDAPAWRYGNLYKDMGWHPYRNSRGEITSWYEYAVEDIHSRKYTNKWLDKLPAGARPICLTQEQIDNHPVLKGEQGVGMAYTRERSEARVDSTRALLAYPLAGICWLVPDAPVTAATHLLALPGALIMIIFAH